NVCLEYELFASTYGLAIYSHQGAIAQDGNAEGISDCGVIGIVWAIKARLSRRVDHRQATHQREHKSDHCRSPRFHKCSKILLSDLIAFTHNFFGFGLLPTIDSNPSSSKIPSAPNTFSHYPRFRRKWLTLACSRREVKAPLPLEVAPIVQTF